MVGFLPVPLPAPFLQSLDMLQLQAETGAGTEHSTYNGVYLLGELKMKGSFWYYYVVLLFYKLPLGTLFLCVASMPLFIMKFRWKWFIEKYMFLLLPAIFFACILSFFNQFQTGLRHILLVFPLVFIGLGRLLQHLQAGRPLFKIITGLSIVYTFISVAIFYPYIIPYTNEFIKDKKTVYTKILDSSIDYNQVHLTPTTIGNMYPGYRVPSPAPDTGKFAISMNQLFDKENWNNSPYNWYRKLQPKGLDKYVILLYDVTAEDLLKAGLGRNGQK